MLGLQVLVGWWVGVGDVRSAWQLVDCASRLYRVCDFHFPYIMSVVVCLIFRCVEKVRKLVKSKGFEAVVLVMIVLSCIELAFESPANLSTWTYVCRWF